MRATSSGLTVLIFMPAFSSVVMALVESARLSLRSKSRDASAAWRTSFCSSGDSVSHHFFDASTTHGV
ncbi:hypothetical protein D3C81_2225220 [compost metagenome]